MTTVFASPSIATALPSRVERRAQPPRPPGVKLGEWVSCERSAPAKGSWRHYAGRSGRIVELNKRDGEIGVRFTSSHDEPTVWFLATELVAAAKPRSAPSIRVRSGSHAVDEPEPLAQSSEAA